MYINTSQTRKLTTKVKPRMTCTKWSQDKLNLYEASEWTSYYIMSRKGYTSATTSNWAHLNSIGEDVGSTNANATFRLMI